jgi:hypothetical protein
VIRDLVTSGLAIPLIVVALLAAMLGFFVTERVAPQLQPTQVRVSVVGLPQSATPSPAPTPTADDGTAGTSGGVGGGGGGGGGGSSNNCPAGCECSGNAQGGIVVVCR